VVAAGQEWMAALAPCARALLGRESVSSTRDVIVDGGKGRAGVWCVCVCVCVCVCACV
jgi:hypothetical protein